MTESTIELIEELQLVAKHNSPQRRAKLDLPLLTELSQRGPGRSSVGEAIDAAVAELALRPESAPIATLFPPAGELWDSNLSGRQRQAAAQVGMSYDSFRRRRNGRPSPYDELCETLLQQLLQTLPQARTPSELTGHDLVTADVAIATSPSPAVAVNRGTVGPGASRGLRLWSALGIGAVVLLVFAATRLIPADSPDEVAAETVITTPSVNLGQPVGLAAAPSGVNIELSWMPPSEGEAPDGYDISRDDVGYWSLDNANITTFTDDSVDPARTYTYAVTAWLANGSDDPADRTYGPSSEAVEIAVTLMQNSLGQPIDLVAVSTSAGNRLEWKPAIEGVAPDGFDIARDGAGYWSLDDPTIGTFTDELVEPGRTYNYAVTPWLANGSDDPADRTYGPSSAIVEAVIAD